MRGTYLCFVAACLVAFGSTALYMGYDSVVITSVFAGLGGIAGYIARDVLAEKEKVEEAYLTED